MTDATNGQARRLPPLPGPLIPRSATSCRPAEKPKRTPETTNRFHQINTFVDCSMADLPRSEVSTWLVLWRDTKPDGTVRTSMADISRRIGSSSRAVVTALAKLQKRGLVTLVFKGGLNRGASVYRVKPVAKPSG